jgi:hypothetical protein
MRNRTLAILGLTGLLVLLTTGLALAQDEELGGKLRTGSDITIAAGETVDHDLYVFGRSIVFNGTINGDIVVAGGTVDLNGAVNGDVIAAGGTITINGPVSGDVRAAGGQITVAADVAEDVLAAAGQITVGGRVGQDLIVSTGELTLSGTVAGSTTGNAGTYNKTGTINGSDGITITSGRNFGPMLPPPDPVFDAVRQFIAVLLIAVLALWLVPRAFGTAEGHVRERPLPSLGWGLVTFVGYFVGIIVIAVLAVIGAIVFGALGFRALLAIDVFGGFVLITALTLAFVIAGVFLADAIVGLALARLVAGRTGWSATAGGVGVARDRWADLGLLAAGVAVVVILTSLPLIGWLFKLLVVFGGLGALWLTWRPPRMAVAGGMPEAPAPPAPTPPAG